VVITRQARRTQKARKRQDLSSQTLAGNLRSARTDEIANTIGDEQRAGLQRVEPASFLHIDGEHEIEASHAHIEGELRQ